MTEDEMREKFEFLKTAFKDSKIKECFYFDHTNCSKEIIRAHSVQENKLLSRIAVNGKVITKKKSYLPFNNTDEMGKAVASTFTGFCKYHDNQLFMPIEDKTYVGSPLQKFLFAYRAFAYVAHKNLEQHKFMETLADNANIPNPNIGLKCNVEKDTPFVNNLFKECFLKEDYSSLITYEITLDYEVSFCVSTSLTLVYDISGKKINNLKDFSKPVHNLFLTIFPMNGKTIMLFSWFKYSDSVYKKWIYQLKSMSQDKMLNYLNQMIINETENFYISPKLWELWGQSGQEEMEQNFYWSMLFNLTKTDLNYTPQFNLFTKI